MGFSVTLCNASKRPNSTNIPSFSSEKEYVCTLLDNCSITSPSIKFHFADNSETASAIKKNYCYIPAFNRYYFINDWESAQNCWIAHCAVDVLATYKNTIGESAQYVTRSAYKSDGAILDTIYPTTGDIDIVEKKQYLQSTTANYNTGCYVLSVINAAPQGIGSVCHYIANVAGIRQVMSELFDTVDWLNLDANEISEELGKALINPMQYIVSCKMIPAVFNGDMVSHDNFAKPRYINIGFWSLKNEHESLIIQPTKTTIKETVKIAITKHPQKSERGSYLQLAPYTRYSLFLPYYGKITIDPAYLVNSSHIQINAEVDLTTGDCLYTITNGGSDPKTISKISTNVAVDIKLAQLTTDVWGTATSAINMAGNTASAIQSLSVGGTITSVASGIESTVKTAMPQLTAVGGVGSVLETGKPISLVTEFYKIVPEDKANRGRPLCEYVKINTLSGYVMCADPKIGISGATSGEVERIRDLMTEGFFYE